MTKVNWEYLVKDELEWELEIRGVSGVGTNKDMIKVLRGLVSSRTGQAESFCEIKRDSKSELDSCTTKLDLIRKLLVPLTSVSQQRRLEAKLVHVLKRLERITPTDDAQTQQKSTLLQQAGNYMVDYEELLEQFKTRQSEAATAAEDDEEDYTSLDPQLSSAAGTSTPRQEVVNPRMEENFTNTASKGIKKTPIYKWQLHFSGEKGSMGVNEFIERAEELSLARGVDYQELFYGAVELLEGKALVWYRSVRKTVNNWEQLCQKLKQEFLPQDYGDKLWELIKKRTQGDNETVGIYLATMDTLFNRMPCSVKEEIRLKIVRKNLLPFYQQQLGVVEVQSLEHLLRLCKTIEANRESIENYVAPRKSNYADLEADLAYGSASSKKVNNVEFNESTRDELAKDLRNVRLDLPTSHRRSNSRNREASYRHSGNEITNVAYQSRSGSPYPYHSRESSRSRHQYGRSNSRNRSTERNRSMSRERRNSSRFSEVVSPRNITMRTRNCYNCDREGHLARECTRPKRIHCYRCGELGYTTVSCVKCNPQGNGRRSQ